MKTQLQTDRAPRAVGPYSQGIQVVLSERSRLLYTAGQIALDPGTGQLVSCGVREQTHRALENLKAILESSDSSLADVVKTTVFLTSMSDFPAMNEVYAQFFGSPPPARSTVAVKDLPFGALVEIEAVAVRA